LSDPLQPQNRTKALVLFCTIVILVLGFLNFSAQWQSDIKTDGVHWVWSDGHVTAEGIDPASPGAKAGILPGDRLRSINFRRVILPQDIGKILFLEQTSVRPLQYEIVRGTEDLVVLVHPQRKSVSFYFFLASVGFVILLIGLVAFLKSRSRDFAVHFYLLCLAFFGTYVFSPTGKLDFSDWIYFWADEVFLLMIPPLFLHFTLIFPGRTDSLPRKKLFLLYLPSLVLMASRILMTVFYFSFPGSPWTITVEGYLGFENVELSYLFVGLATGVALLFLSYAKAEDIIQKKQLKLVLAGMVAGFGPYLLLWLISLAVRVPSQALEAALVPQILIPLSLTYALFKYRLMDVDIIIKRGMIYTVTTMLLFVMYLFLTISWVQFILPQATRAKTVTIASLTTLLAALLFQPLRDRVRALVDRFYYKDSYDYRRTLVQFSREITSSFDMGQMADSLLRHIRSTFRVERADLLLKVHLNRFESVMDKNHAINPGVAFLTRLSTDPFVLVNSPGFSDRELEEDEEILRSSNLYYFVPCKFKHNIVALLALSKKEKGDYLSSDDLDLLSTMSGQLAIVIENHRLFYTLKNKADELERVKNFNENILFSLNVGIVTLDDNAKVVACNNYIETFLDVTRPLILGRTLDELFPAEIVDRYRNYSLKTPRKKLEGTRFYKTLVENVKEKDHVVNLSFVPLINESDVEYGTIMILDDVTHQAKLEEQLTQAEKLSALGLLAAGVAHEVNTPLTGISSYTQMLEQQMQTDPDTKEILEKIEQQTFRASKIINTLLDLSREQPVPSLPIDINNLLRETLVLLRPHFKDLPIELTQELDASAPVVLGNEGKLQQVFTNLFLNAKDAIHTGGRVLVRTESDNDVVIIDIVDSGVGIDEKTLKRIYEPFFTTKKGLKGTGLGLAITYTIIQEHKGSIDVFSEEGRGTHFQIKLPRLKKEVHEQSRAYSGD
jgi:two-component system NtrC family sensor kinase